MIRYIVFDFDGTLADSITAFKEIMREEFGEIPEEDFELFREEGIKSVLRKNKIPLWKLPKLAKKATTALQEREILNLYPGIKEVIGKLHKNYKLGIASSNSEGNIVKTLKNEGIDELFEFVSSEIAIFGKDRVLKKICRKYKIDPSEMIYIGDEDRDIVAARKVGIKNIAVKWGYCSERRIREVEPDYFVQSIEEIEGVIQKMVP